MRTALLNCTFTFLVMVGIAPFTQAQTVYYYSGSGDLADLNNWDDAQGATLGSVPISFSDGVNTFFDLDGNSGSIQSSWTFDDTLRNSGASATITINDGQSWILSGIIENTSSITIEGVTGTGVLALSAGSLDLPEINNVNLDIGTGTKTATSSITINQLGSPTGNGTLNMSTHALVVSSVSITAGSIYLRTANTSANPISGIAYPTGDFVEFYADATQTIPSGATFGGGLRLQNCDISLTEDLDVDGFFQIQGDATLNAGTHGFTGNAAISASGTSKVTTSNTSATPFPASSTFNDIELNASSTAQNLPASTTVNGTLTLNNNSATTALGTLSAVAIDFQGTSDLDMSTYQLTSTTTVTSTGANVLSSAYISAANEPFPVNISGLNSTNVTVTLNGAGDQVIPGNTTGYYDFNVEGSGTKHILPGTTVTMTNGGGMDVSPGVDVDVDPSGTLTFDNSTLTLNADATGYAELRMRGTLGINNSPTFIKEYYLDLSSPRWFHMGTAMSGADLQDLNEGQTMISANDATGSVWAWDASTSEWTNPSLTGNSPESGYAIYAGTLSGVHFLRNGSGIVTSQGTALLTADAVISPSYHNGSGSSATFTTGTIDGWNLIANPYTATYDWEAQAAVTDLDDAVYVWDGSSSSYTSYVNGVGANSGTQYIAPGQAFWIRAQSASVGTLTLDVDNTVVGQAPSFFKRNDYASLTVRDTADMPLDETVIRFEGQSTTGFDPSWDAYKLLNGQGVPNLYVSLHGEDYSICSTPNSVASFPISLEANSYVQPLTMKLDVAQLSTYQKAYIEDKFQNQWVEISNGGSYTFMPQANDPSNRFILHFSSEGINIDEHTTSGVSAAYHEGELMIFNANDFGLEARGKLVNIQGQVVCPVHSQLDQPITRVQVPALSTGVYLLQLEIEEECITEKIIIP